jgi:hypothetical protein
MECSEFKKNINKILEETVMLAENAPKKKTQQVYDSKFRSAVYAFFLFIILSNQVSYKILDLIVKVFVNNITIIEDDNPHFIGTIIMATVIAIVILIF